MGEDALIQFALNDLNSNDEQIVKKYAQTFLKVGSIILQLKSSNVATLKHHCLDYAYFKPKLQLI